MSYYKAGTPYSEDSLGPVLLGVRGNVPPAYEGGESSLAPVALDASGRLLVTPGPDDFNSSYYATASSNTAVAVTLAAPAPDEAWEISGVSFSYTGGTTAGALTIGKGSVPTTVFSVDVAAIGHVHIPFPSPRRGGAGEQLVVTLAAGGSGVTGKLNVLGVRLVTAPGFPERLPGMADGSDPNQSGLV